MIDPIHSHRLDVLHSLYADIARESLAACNSALAECKSIDRETDYEAFAVADTKATRAALTGIVFAALSLEAQIYDFAARYLGDHYVATHLDKLDLVGKWMVIPRLVCGKELQKDQRPFNALKELVRIRNQCVHHRSMTGIRKTPGEIDWDATLERLESREKALLAGVKSAGDALDMLQLELFLMTEDSFAFLAIPESQKAEALQEMDRRRRTMRSC